MPFIPDTVSGFIPDTVKPVDTELTWAEKNIAPLLPDFLQGNMRGSAVGRAMMGAADPGVAIAQLGANLVGQGDRVNQSIADTEKEYQSARNGAGSTGFDPLRMAGNAAMTLPLGLAGKVPTSLAGMAGQGAVMGGGFAALEPVTNGGNNFWRDKLKQVGTGAAVGAIAAPAVSTIASAISPNVSKNVSLLQDAGVQPTIGQAIGGRANRLEEAAQSLPVIGGAIKNARQRATDQFEQAAFNKAAAPIGEKISERGNAGIAELSSKLEAAYDQVIPKLAINVTDPKFIEKMASLRSMAQSLPEKEAQQFDNILAREIDGRVAPNGVLSGQNLKDAWRSLRDTGNQYAKSNDAYQSQLGQAVKQAFQELKTQVAATNPLDVVLQLKNADLSYASFKRLQRAASTVGAEEGRFSPSQLHSAVKAMDRSKDKARFAEGEALMQDLSSAGKSVLSNKVPNSGTYDRAAIGGLILGTPFAPHVTLPAMAGLGAGAVAYTPEIQNALTTLMTKRPDMAPQIANYLRQMMPAITAGVVPATLQSRQQ